MGGTVRTIGILLTVLLIIIGIAFTALNAQAVEVNYLLGSKQLPLAAILMICLALGVLVTGLSMGYSLLKLKAKNKWLESRLKKNQSQH